MKPLTTMTRRAFAALAMAAGLATTAAAADFTIRYASPYPPNHVFSKADLDYFAKVKEETGGRVDFQPYWARTLISDREGIEQLASGVADMAFIAPIYSRTGKEMTQSMSGWIDPRLTPVQKVEIWWKVWDKYPELRKEYDGVHLIAAHAGENMHIQTADRPVRTIEDLKGLRLKATGESVTLLNELGAAAVAMPMGEVYVGLQKGILDGTVAPYETLVGFKFGEVIKYYTKLPLPRSAYGSRAMDQEAWDKLPEDIQKVLMDNSMYWAERVEHYSAEQDQKGIDFGMEQGVEFIEPDKEVYDVFVAKMDEVWAARADELNAKGLPGTEYMNDVKTWSRELAEKSSM
jgi:TRAP-type C4-dicarboxylate transport system substrate-binding protein